MRTLLLILLCVIPSISNAICIYEPLEERLDNAKIVFIATLVSGTVSGPIDKLKNGEPYRVNYTFVVRDRIKGDPSLVTQIYGMATYHDPFSDIYWDPAEELILTPGDNVLVITQEAGYVSVTYCGPSKKWNESSEKLKAYRLKHAL